MDSIQCITSVGMNGVILAQGRTPSLVIDTQMLSESNFCAISDKNILMYSLIPNVKNNLFKSAYKSIIAEISKLPFDNNIYNGLVFEDKQKLDEEEQEDLKINDGSERFIFNLLVSAIIPSSSSISFILPSNFGQYTLQGGIDGMLMQLGMKLNQEVHKPKYQLAAFALLFIQLMYETQEGRGKNQVSVSDVVQLIHKIYHKELEFHQITQKDERQYSNQFAIQHINQIDNDEWMHYAIKMADHTYTSYDIMSCLPELNPFILLSRRGQCSCTIPVRYDQMPFIDLGQRAFSSAVSAMNFGHVWNNPQTKLFPDYDEYEIESFQKYVSMEIEEELAQTGNLSIIPPHPVMRYHYPVYPLRFGRYIDQSVNFGLSPHPLITENLQWRNLEPWQIRKAIAMMGIESDVRQRWVLSERDRVRKLLNLSVPSELIENQHFPIQEQQDMKVENQNLIKMFKEIRIYDNEDENKEISSQQQLDEKEQKLSSSKKSDQISQSQISLLKNKINSRPSYINPMITTGNTELTIYQHSLSILQEQISPQFQKKNEILNIFTNDAFEHPIPLNNIQRAIFQNRILKLPKAFQ
ncbi:MAG: hypothetical protein EZS28_015510 [Streblomastix strix]|uniref:Uncharacterized protein n=1 Tax=Streblomastix strix TaxID=222440 RepID=A0A5J4W392_9EUKA|nr:MAG: hypothetical protein EZS28_015510 [Streblomastix strix]